MSGKDIESFIICNRKKKHIFFFDATKTVKMYSDRFRRNEESFSQQQIGISKQRLQFLSQLTNKIGYFPQTHDGNLFYK